MHYYSTRDPRHLHPATLSEAVLRGLAPDGGLYLPERIDPLPAALLDQIERLPLEEVAYEAARILTGGEVPADVLKQMVQETIDFELPLAPVEPGVYCLELFHGPTLAFKDVGARFMARLMSYFVSHSREQLHVVVATSGDTGSAVAAGFFGVPGILVTILYPKGKVSPLQEKQLTTWGGNIAAVEVEGTFDDCQRMAKRLLADEALNAQTKLTSANSINIARLIPQSFYYFAAYAKLKSAGLPVVVCVPSGNFGNLTGGLLAKMMGLPIQHFVAATNANNVVPQYVMSGKYEPRASVQTISNAMDVGNPSNFERMQSLFGDSLEAFRANLSAASFTDGETRTAMQQVHQSTGYILDPHGAVGYLGLVQYMAAHPHTAFNGVFLGTAHPAKFLEVVEPALGVKVQLPEHLQAFAERPKQAQSCPNSYEAVREIVASR
jgi:threonine synthase